MHENLTKYRKNYHSNCLDCGKVIRTVSKRCQSCFHKADTIPAIKRFWNFVDKTPGQGPEGTCWIWIGQTDKDGYGIFRSTTTMDAPKVRASRYSYEIHKGPIPSNNHACHSCDNPPCINPDHLFAGTDTDNMHDASQKGRVLKGESHKMAKLNNAQVAWIKSNYRRGCCGGMSKKFHVIPETIRLIGIGRTWKHIH